MPTAAWWKSFYAQERASLDLDALLDAAPAVPFPEAGAMVFPHTRLTVSGALVAAVARAAARTRREVLALGVLHRGKDRDPALRGIHLDSGLAAEEFSLDGFRALYERACRRDGVEPRLTARYPFLTGEHPEDLPGVQSLPRDAVLVGTADPIHHGVGYGTPESRDDSSPETKADARRRIEEHLSALSAGDFGAFAQLCARDLSDFRDVGPVMAALRPGARWTLDELRLVDYSDVLSAARPTWVAAGRIAVTSTRASL